MVTASHFDNASPERIAQFLGINDPAATWTASDMEAIYRHQLATPLQVELAALGSEDAMRLTTLADARGLLLKSIGDLLHHPHPPVVLLAMLKDFGKRLMEHSDKAFPRDVAAVLYWAAIAASHLRLSARLSSLDDAKLVAGFQWASKQTWVDAATADLLRAAALKLSGGAAE